MTAENGMGNSVYAHNSSCIYMSHLLYVEFYSTFQYVEGVTPLEGMVSFGHLSGNKWPLGAGQVSQIFGVM